MKIFLETIYILLFFNYKYVSCNDDFYVRDWLDALTENVNRLRNVDETREVLQTFAEYLIKQPFGQTLTQSLSSNSLTFNISETCSTQLKLFAAELYQNRSDWTLKILDAVAKPPSGILLLNFLWLGSYTECMNITANVGRSDIQGQYCVSSLGFQSNNSEILKQFSSMWSFYFGICLPNGCNAADAQQIMEIVSVPISSYINVTKTICPQKKIPFDVRAIAVITLCAVILTLLVIGTLWELILIHCQKTTENEKSDLIVNTSAAEVIDEYTPLITNVDKGTPSFRDSSISKFVLCFSLLNSTSKILDTKLSEGSLPCLHGIRFLSMSWVILGHTIVFGMVFYDNIIIVPDVIKSYAFQVINNGTVSVDSFFTLSGLLVGYLFMKEYSKNGTVSLPKFYFHRFWRLTPVYMLFMGTYISLFKYFGSGPLWPQEGLEKNYCMDTWWKNLLYINNFWSLNGMCMSWTWYLANDMQFYIISPIMLYILFRQPIIGSVVTSLFILSSWITTGVLSSYYGFLATMTQFTNVTLTQDYMDKIYIKPYCRIGPYLIGLLCGYLIFRNEKRISLPKWSIVLGWLIAGGFAYAVIYGLYDSMNGFVLSNGVNALYNSLSRSAWALSLSWVIFACISGYGGPINKLLSWQVWIPLSRLTYSAYLVHPVVMYWYYYNLEKPIDYSHKEMTFAFFSLLIMSYAVGFVVSVSFEAPMLALEKLLIKRKKD